MSARANLTVDVVAEEAVVVVVDPDTSSMDEGAASRGLPRVCVRSAMKAWQDRDGPEATKAKAHQRFLATVDFAGMKQTLAELGKYTVTAVHTGSEPGTELAIALSAALDVPCDEAPVALDSLPSTPSDVGSVELKELLEWADSADDSDAEDIEAEQPL